MNFFMQQAIEESRLGIQAGHGGPFGAVLVQNGGIIASGHNMVLQENDPTAHAEIVTLRLAAKKLGTFCLSGCEMYSSCEPCPMCYSALHWARIDRLFFAAKRSDAARIGFDDEKLYGILAGKEKPQFSCLYMGKTEQDGAVEIMELFHKNAGQLY